MKILYFWAEDSTFMSQWQRLHFINELESKGHTIEVFNPLKFENYEHANEELILYVKNNVANINLFMTCLKSDEIFKETISEINKHDIPSLLICFDNLHAPYNHKDISHLFDLVWLTSIETKALFDKWGANTIFMPYAANPNSFYPNFKKEIDSVGFIGTPYGTRTNKINLLTSNNVKCSIYSDNINNPSSINISMNRNIFNSFCNLMKFPIGRKVVLGAFIKKMLIKENDLLQNPYISMIPSVSFSEMNDLYSNHSLSLGISELRNTYTLKRPVHKLHLRTFEIPMCGGLQITSYTDELASYFDNDREIVMYKSDEELISKAKFYLNPNKASLRRDIKQAAREKALMDHTWSRRFQVIFKHLKV